MKVTTAEVTSPAPPVQSTARGSSGTKLFAGFFNEEYLPELRGQRLAEAVDKMRRSDGQIKMVTSAVINPIKAANWEMEPGAEGAQYQSDADFAEHLLFRDMDKPFTKFLGEALTCVYHGYSLFEVVHKVVLNHPEFGSYTGIKTLGFRSQRTIYQWKLAPDTGALMGVVQMAYGDLQRYVEIPGEFLLHFAIDQEGDNYEGIAMVRTCYGPWLRKWEYLKLMAIGIEKTAVPTAKGKVPKNMQDSPEYNRFREILETYTSSETGYVLLTEGWDIEFIESDFDPSKVITAIEFEDKQMARALLAVFLELGQTGGGGSYSLALNQGDFFLSAVEFIADIIAGAINQKLIPQLIKMNRGERDHYPKLKHSGIRDKIGIEFGNLLKALAEAQILKPDDRLEEHVRRRIGVPPMSLEGQREVKPPGAQLPPTAGEVQTLSERQAAVHLSEKPRAVTLIEKGRDDLAAVMRTNLKASGDALVKSIMKAVRAAPASQRPSARRGIDASGRNAYKAALVSSLSSLAAKAMDQARAEVPKKRNVRLHDEPEPLTRAIRLDDYDKLPTRVKAKIQSQAELLADTHTSDLEKAIGFAFDHSEGSTDSDALLENDLQDAADRVVDSAGIATGASNTAALVVNEARNGFFFEPEVLEGIASFTFANPDPVTPICQDLAGQTFDPNDAGAWRYFPPLHHNCKSVWIPNPKGRDEPNVTGLKPSKASLEKYITLHEPLSKRLLRR